MRRVQPAKLAIVARGETQKSVAANIDHHLATLNQALNGEIRPSQRLKDKLAAYLNIDTSQLFIESDWERL